jgi:CheY-like chemotaxis protein
MRHAVPDLVVSDHEMPGLNGTDLRNVMRAHSKLDDVPMILITAFDASPAVHQLRGAVCQVLYKPFGRDELITAVDAALGQTA